MVHKKLKDIAKHLTDWALIEPQYDHGGTIEHPGGASIFIRLEGGTGGKASASGSYHCDLKYDDSPSTHGLASHSIKFSPDKSAEKIASDIARRLIPEYMIDHNTWSLRVSEYKTCMANADRVKAKITGEIPRLTFHPFNSDDRQEQDSALLDSTSGHYYIKAKVNHDGTSVDLGLQGLTDKQALKLIRLYKAMSIEGNANE